MAALTCPSARAEPGAALLGVLGEDGRIHNLRTSLTVDAAFVAEVSRSGTPEARMRFAAPCREGGCAQWTGRRCGVVEQVLAHLGPEAAPAPSLPPCTIRATCRWFAQEAAAACAACSYVVTGQAEAELIA